MYSGNSKQESESQWGIYKIKALSRYGTELTKEASQLDPVVGRDEEIKYVIQILCKKSLNNVMLIGEPGVGKSAIVEGVAYSIVMGNVPSQLRDVRIISLNVGSLLAGAKYRGEFEERLQAILNEVEKADGSIVLFIDEMHLLIGAGSSVGGMDAANYLKPMLARGKLRCIGATTIDEHRKYIEKDRAFARRFQLVNIDEPSVTVTTDILRGLKEKYEIHHGVRIEDQALVKAVELSATCIKESRLPYKAIDLVDEACASVDRKNNSQLEEITGLEKERIKHEMQVYALKKKKDESSKIHLENVKKLLVKAKDRLSEYTIKEDQLKEVCLLRQERLRLQTFRKEAERKADWSKVTEVDDVLLPLVQKKIEQLERVEELYATVGPEQIAEVVSRQTGIPVTKLSQTEKERLSSLAERLGKKVLGQASAVEIVAATVIRARVRILTEDQPVGSFLFMGPTGVGKTELAKALAEQLSDEKDILVRIDMSEYMEKHSISRLIGAPPGYVGYDEGGQLTRAVKLRPYSVVLFDEVEKANVLVLNVLLQILSGGRLTDGKGETVDFSHAIIILTSNLGANDIVDGLLEKKTSQQARDDAIQKVREHFRPEFLGRLSEIVIFDPLKEETLREIVKIQVEKIRMTLNLRNCQMVIKEDAIQHTLSKNLTPIYGARQIGTWMMRNVGNKLAHLKMNGELQDDSFITVCMEGGVLAVKAGNSLWLE